MTFFRNLEQFSDSIALTEDTGKSINYRQLANDSDNLAKEFGEGRKLIVIKCRNNLETITGYLAALRGGHVALMVDGEIDPALLDKLISPYYPNCIWESDGDGTYSINWLYKEPHNSLHSDVSLLLSTSGSTGSPKLVKLSSQNLESNASAIGEYLSLDSTEQPVTTLQLHYSYGLSILNSHLKVGSKIALTNESVMRREFWEFFKSVGGTSLSGVPYIYEMLYRLRLERMDLPSLRYMTQAGGKLNQKLVKHFAKITQDKGAKLYVMYGQTEATARISWLPPEKIEQKADSIGIAIPGGELFLEAEDGSRIIECGKEGVLMYTGPNVMLGYAECAADLNKPVEKEQILNTGDIARQDEDGYFYITGRTKRFIKLHGNRIGLDEIERDLIDAGYDCICTGIDNHLLVVTLENHGESIVDFLSNRYHIHSSVVDIKKVGAYPRSAAGKVLYGELLNMLTAA